MKEYYESSMSDLAEVHIKEVPTGTLTVFTREFSR
jgi:hypothetical protein